MKVRLIFGLSSGLLHGLAIYIFSNNPDIKGAIIQGIGMTVVMTIIFPLLYKKSK